MIAANEHGMKQIPACGSNINDQTYRSLAQHCMSTCPGASLFVRSPLLLSDDASLREYLKSVPEVLLSALPASVSMRASAFEMPWDLQRELIRSSSTLGPFVSRSDILLDLHYRRKVPNCLALAWEWGWRERIKQSIWWPYGWVWEDNLMDGFQQPFLIQVRIVAIQYLL